METILQITALEDLLEAADGIIDEQIIIDAQTELDLLIEQVLDRS